MRIHPVLAGALAGAVLASAAVGGILSGGGDLVGTADAKKRPATSAQLQKKLKATDRRVIVNLRRTNKNTKDIAALSNATGATGASGATGAQGPTGPTGPKGRSRACGASRSEPDLHPKPHNRPRD